MDLLPPPAQVEAQWDDAPAVEYVQEGDNDIPLPPPQYSAVGVALTLHLTQPHTVGDIAVCTVGSTESHDFSTTLFVIEQHVPTSTDIRSFKVFPSGDHIDPDALDDYYYSFRLFTIPVVDDNDGRIGFIRIIGGRGVSTPCQVSPFPSFIHLGIREACDFYGEFLNPFKSGQNFRNKPLGNGVINRLRGSLARYEWISGIRDADGDDRVEFVYRLRVWDEDVKKKLRSAPTVVAEYRVTDSGSTLTWFREDVSWTSTEEAAFLVGTAYAVHMAHDVRPSRITKSMSAVDRIDRMLQRF
ncbi:hypothetical protein HDU83_009332 [Entophlyctis luteolus]|nr:hypothetical protein HDU83_009332 [Entophlyctis luteolus]